MQRPQSMYDRRIQAFGIDAWIVGHLNQQLRNLRLIREARATRKENIDWLKDIEVAFAEAAEESRP